MFDFDKNLSFAGFVSILMFGFFGVWLIGEQNQVFSIGQITKNVIMLYILASFHLSVYWIVRYITILYSCYFYAKKELKRTTGFAGQPLSDHSFNFECPNLMSHLGLILSILYLLYSIIYLTELLKVI